MWFKQYGHVGSGETRRMIHLQSVHWPWTVILVMKLLTWSRQKLKKQCMFTKQWSNIIKQCSLVVINWSLKRQLSWYMFMFILDFCKYILELPCIKLSSCQLTCYSYSLSEIMYHELIIQNCEICACYNIIITMFIYCNNNNSLCFWSIIIVLTDIILSLSVGDDLKPVEQTLRLYQNILLSANER